MKNLLPPYIKSLIRTVLRDEVFEVRPALIPKGWTYERVLLEPGHWMVTVLPEPGPRCRAFNLLHGPLTFIALRVGPYSYNLLVPAELMPSGDELRKRFIVSGPSDPCPVRRVVASDGTSVPIVYPPSQEVA